MTEEKKVDQKLEDSNIAVQTNGENVAPFPLKVILGQKVGMTQIFNERGENIPVTVVYAGGCRSTNIKTEENDGYSAVQLGYGIKREKSMSKPYQGVFTKRGIPAAEWLKEFRVADSKNLTIGQNVSVNIFSPGDYVDVSGTSKGKGFAGVMKRHGFSGLPMSHGASDKTRSPGSSGGGSGQGQRVLKGTRMAGHMGVCWVTTQKLEIVKVDQENNLLMIKGAIPGVSKGFIVVKETTKARKKILYVQPKITKKAQPERKASKPK